MKSFLFQILVLAFLLLHFSCTFRPAEYSDENGLEEADVLPLESPSINLMVKGHGELLLEMNSENNTICIYLAPDMDSAIQILGPLHTQADFMDEVYYQNPYLIFNPEDLNFDGYADLKIPSSHPDESEMFTVFLYNPEKKKFVEHQELSTLQSLYRDSVNKRITSLTISGLTGNFFIHNTYRWKNNKLKLERIEKQDGTFESPDIFLRTVLKVRADTLLDTMAVVRILKEVGKESWCLEQGDWKALDATPFPGVNVTRLKGDDGGCY